MGAVCLMRLLFLAAMLAPQHHVSFLRTLALRAALGTTFAVLGGGALVGCDKAPLTAPTDSAVTLFANQTVVALSGSVEITANVTEPGGVPVQNGTQVNFTTT